MTATCLRADQLANEGKGDDVERLADFFCQSAQLRVDDYFRHLGNNTDRAGYRIAQDVLKGVFSAVESGIVRKP
jgi:hypothetical protein